MDANHIIFLIQSPDKMGILAGVTSFFYQEKFNVLSCQQFTDTIAETYFMRVSLDARDLTYPREELEKRFQVLADELELGWECHYTEDKINTAILASKTNHCLFDLLEKHGSGKLKCSIPLVISNHESTQEVAKLFNIPFHYIPVTKERWATQQGTILQLLEEHNIEFVVLARFMRILSSEFLSNYPNQIINIHHAILPAFQGAKPYHRAYERGVKMIGATAHYATADLDEGPIIEQDVERVSHDSTPASLTQIGSEIERKVLTKAVHFHLDHRIIVKDNRTIVFPETND